MYYVVHSNRAALMEELSQCAIEVKLRRVARVACTCPSSAHAPPYDTVYLRRHTIQTFI